MDQYYDTCQFNINGNNAGSGVQLRSGSIAQTQRFTWFNTTVSFAGAGNSGIQFYGCDFRWLKTPTAFGGTAPNTLSPAEAAERTCFVLMDGVDISALSTKTIFGSVLQGLNAQLINCKLPASITLVSGALVGQTYDFINCASSGIAYNQTRVTYQGTLTASTTVTNGATDGTTPISWQVVSTANAKPQSPFECFEIAQWVPAGTYASTTIIATSATGALTTDDIWADCYYMASAATRRRRWLRANGDKDTSRLVSSRISDGRNMGGWWIRYQLHTRNPVVHDRSSGNRPLQGLCRQGKPDHQYRSESDCRMISRREFMATTAAAAILAETTFIRPALAAATNRQYMAGGGFRPVYVNGVGTNEYFASRMYINDTQVPAAGGASQHLPLLGAS